MKRYLSNKLMTDLNNAIKATQALIDKAEGKESSCAVESLKDSVLYITTWILGPLTRITDEMKK